MGTEPAPANTMKPRISSSGRRPLPMLRRWADSVRLRSGRPPRGRTRPRRWRDLAEAFTPDQHAAEIADPGGAVLLAESGKCLATRSGSVTCTWRPGRACGGAMHQQGL